MDGRIVIAYLFGILFLFIVGRAFQKPAGFVFRLLINAVAGGLVLWGLNTLGRAPGISLALNPFTALVTGFLGMPGVGWMLAVKYWVLH